MFYLHIGELSVSLRVHKGHVTIYLCIIYSEKKQWKDIKTLYSLLRSRKYISTELILYLIELAT